MWSAARRAIVQLCRSRARRRFQRRIAFKEYKFFICPNDMGLIIIFYTAEAAHRTLVRLWLVVARTEPLEYSVKEYGVNL